MACATLKRTQNFDILDSVMTKRRKFGSYIQDYDPPTVRMPESPFAPSESVTHVQLKRRIKEEIKRLQRRRLIPRFLGSPVPTTQPTFSGHVHEDNAAIASCSGCFRSLALRSPPQDSQDSDSDQSPLRHNEASFQGFQANSSSTTQALSSPTVSSSRSLSTSRNIDSVPIFTLPQVTALCDRLIKEREAELRQEYDNILSCKLAEQYEAFLKFNHDQLYSRFQNTPMSYVS
ncbi:unnamed protein product [Dicrocoelium dendriticum]|nr:unnamed protein product [Dicrocoelium dendriticum]